MNPKLFTMLNPKTVNWSGSGGGGDLTVSDFNFACSGADPIGLEVLKRKWGGVSTDEDFETLLNEILQLSRYWKIKDNRENKIKGLFELVLFESTKLPVCSHCRGKGERITKGKLADCNPCRGTGYYRIKKSEKARYLGVSKQAWVSWESRYHDVKALLDEHVYKAMRHIDKRMRED